MAPRVQTIPVEVIELGESYALCLDYFGVHREVPLNARRAKGLRPRPGEIWLIDREMGDWMFSVCIQSVGESVTGEVVAGSALSALLNKLDTLGVVDDQTERVPDWGRWMNVNP